MGWRDTQTAVQSGELSFVQKEDALGEAFKTGANILAKSMIQKAAEKKEEEKLLAAAEAAERKRINAAQDKATAAEEKMKTNARILSQNYTGDTQPKTVSYFFQQLQLNEGDVGSVESSTQTRLDNNTLDFIAATSEYVGREEITVPGQIDPRDPPRVRPSDRTDAQMEALTSGSQDPDLGNYRESEKELTGVREVTEGQVNITPYGSQTDKIDYSRLNTLENMKLYLLEVKNGDINLSDDDIETIEKQLEDASDKALMTTVRSIINNPEDAKAMNDTNIALGVESVEATIVASIVKGQLENAKPWEEFLSPGTIAAASDVETLITLARIAEDIGASDEDLVLVNSEITAREERIKTDRSWVADATVSKDKAFAAIQLYTQNNDEANLKIAQSIYLAYENQDPAYASLLEVSSLLGKTSTELLEIRSGAVSLNAPEKRLEFLDKTLKEVERLEESQEARKYLEKATSLAKTQAQIQLAQAEKAPQAVIDRLIGLAVSQKKADLEVSLASNGIVGAKAIDAVFTDPTTEKLGYGVLILLPDGTTQTQDGTVVTGSRAMSDLESDRFGDLAVQTNKYFMEASTSGVAIAEGLRGAENLITIAREEPRVRDFSGDFAQNTTNLVRGGTGVFSVLQSLFDNGAETVTEEQLRAAVAESGGSNESMLDAIISGDVQQLANQTAQFEAGMLALVFRSGKMEGQSGNAMSNKDFDRLQTMLNVEGGFEAFEATLRRYMADKIKSYDLKGQTLLDGAVGSFEKDYKYLPIQTPLTFSEVVGRNGDPELQTAYDNTVGFSAAAPVAEIVPAPVSQLEIFQNTGSYTVYDEKGEPSIRVQRVNIEEVLEKQKTPEARKNFLTELAKSMGTTYEKLTKLTGLK